MLTKVAYHRMLRRIPGPVRAEAVWKLRMMYASGQILEAGMSGYIEGVERGQATLFPDRLE
ncbi:hypothetical protein, partial [Roseobacter sp. EG26]|uniref:hypothetical protein n=1 Tax=Roseobacter sp. EG26 TaxID=3412477 RepID=UPI003CE4855E